MTDTDHDAQNDALRQLARSVFGEPEGDTTVDTLTTDNGDDHRDFVRRMFHSDYATTTQQQP